MTRSRFGSITFHYPLTVPIPYNVRMPARGTGVRQKLGLVRHRAKAKAKPNIVHHRAKAKAKQSNIGKFLGHLLKGGRLTADEVCTAAKVIDSKDVDIKRLARASATKQRIGGEKCRPDTRNVSRAVGRVFVGGSPLPNP